MLFIAVFLKKIKQMKFFAGASLREILRMTKVVGSLGEGAVTAGD